MIHLAKYPLRWLLAVALLVAVPAVPAAGQTPTPTGGSPTTHVTIDVPTPNTTISNGVLVFMGGWALDTNGPGTGVDQVRVYLDGLMDSGGTLLGNATYGGSRPDVAQVFGNTAFTNTGWNFQWTPPNLSPGTHTIYVYAHATSSNVWSYRSVPVNVTAPAPTPTPSGMGPGYPGYYPPPPPRYPPPPPPPLYPYPFPPSQGGSGVCTMIYPPPPGCAFILPAPSNVTVSAVTPTSVTLTWSAVTGAVRYRVVQTAGGVANQTTVTSTSVTIGGLQPGTSYSFQVFAIDAQGQQSQPSNTVTATTGTPVVNPLGAPSQFGPQPQFGPQNFPAGPSPRLMYYPPIR